MVLHELEQTRQEDAALSFTIFSYSTGQRPTGKSSMRDAKYST